MHGRHARSLLSSLRPIRRAGKPQPALALGRLTLPLPCCKEWTHTQKCEPRQVLQEHLPFNFRKWEAPMVVMPVQGIYCVLRGKLHTTCDIMLLRVLGKLRKLKLQFTSSKPAYFLWRQKLAYRLFTHGSYPREQRTGEMLFLASKKLFYPFP